jgi:PIN domain nuclease of toxin-antitoxin system
LADPEFFVVDTHALVWHLEDSPKLGRAAARILRDRESELIIPSIVLAETRYLSAKIPPRVSWDDVLLFITSGSRNSIFPLDEEIISDLPVQLEMHDAIVCRTAVYWTEVLLLETAVLTKDKQIVNSGLVKTLW